MSNVWEFLLQTLSVSLTAGLLLIVKYLLADKLSPRWQYAIWWVLALRVLIPASMEHFLLHPIPLWLETWKGMAEDGLHSVYSSVGQVISVKAPIPWIAELPFSLTDWFFVLYATGVLGALAWYVISYLRLRMALRRGVPGSEDLEEQMLRVSREYGLRPCRVVSVKGLTSAFVCGVFRPVLAVPAGAELDGKVALHELLHLKYGDSLQNLFWCVLRALHWCNPFLQYVFNRIGNDMESLCDHRVLERLEGEERRSYGAILLSMANDRYPRAPGTTSISNGGKNITRRIEAIVRFKKYPKGMALVSVCTAVMLAAQVLCGSAADYASQNAYIHPTSEAGLAQSMAMARLERCTTPAAAIDTYVKALRWENGVMLALVSPISQQPALVREMDTYRIEGGWGYFHIEPGKYLDYLFTSEGYYIANLAKQEDGSYTAVLVFGVYSLLDEEGFLITDETGNSWLESTVLIPIIVYQDNGWVVRESGERQAYQNLSCGLALESYDIPILANQEVYEGSYGTLTVYSTSLYYVCGDDATWTFFDRNSLDNNSLNFNLDQDFSGGGYMLQMEYQFHGTLEEWSAFPGASINVLSVLTDENGTATDTNSVSRANKEDRTLMLSVPYSHLYGLAQLASYTVTVNWNGEKQEEFRIEKELSL